jgi:shikimate dehydrogenase
MTETTFLKLGVIGDPVEHSASPRLQRRLLDAAGVPGSYEAIRVPAGTGASAIEDLRERGYVGLNVTTPLKREAFARAEWHDATALATGSVNTLVLGERIEGYNTDGIGVLGGLADAGLRDVAGSRILVLGAGPTARTAVATLVAAGAAVFVWNRTVAKAEALVREFDAHAFAAGLRFDAVLSTLAPGAEPNDRALVAAVIDAPVFVDANYAARATLARFFGRRGVDGLAMLEHSARASFELWRVAFAP